MLRGDSNLRMNEEKVECPECLHEDWEGYFEDEFGFTCPICGTMFE